MEVLTHLVQAGVASLLLAVLVIVAYRFTLVGAGLMLGMFLCEAFFLSLPAFEVGPVALFPQDVLFCVLAAAGATRLLTRLLLRKGYTWLELTWVAFGFLIVFSFLRGALAYGLEVAGVEFRQYFYLFAGTLYFMSAAYTAHALKRLSTLWFFTAGALVLLTLFRWMAQSIGLPIAAQWSELLVGSEMRVLNASQTLFLAQAWFLSLFLWVTPKSSWIWRFLAVALLPTLVLLQHRTVWVLCLVCIFIAMVYEKELRAKMLILTIVGLMAGALLALGLWSSELSSVTQSLGASTTEVLDTRQSTFAWRVESWRVLLTEGQQLSTITDYLFGRPFGTGYTRFLEAVGRVVEETPHNYYVQTMLRTGLLGLGALVCVYVVLLVHLRRSSGSDWVGYFGPRALQVLVISQLLYFISYSPTYEQGLLLGLAISAARFGSPEKVQERKKTRRVRVVWASHV